MFSENMAAVGDQSTIEVSRTTGKRDILLNAQSLISNSKYRIPKSSISSLNPKQGIMQSVGPLSHNKLLAG